MAGFKRRKDLKLKNFGCQLYASERKRKRGREGERERKEGGEEEKKEGRKIDSFSLTNQ